MYSGFKIYASTSISYKQHYDVLFNEWTCSIWEMLMARFRNGVSDTIKMTCSMFICIFIDILFKIFMLLAFDSLNGYIILCMLWPGHRSPYSRSEPINKCSIWNEHSVQQHKIVFTCVSNQMENVFIKFIRFLHVSPFLTFYRLIKSNRIYSIDMVG